MWNIIPGSDRYRASHGWLTSYHHFSFADYHDPGNVQFGSLRVFNEDFIAPHSGFPMHPHDDMEIVSLVFSGALTHEDSMGNRGQIGSSEVQRMSAGTGVVHSEFNHGDEEVHLLQIWILPDKKDHEPRYGQQRFSTADRTNKLLPVVGPVEPAPIHIHQDATFFLSHLEANHEVNHAITGRRKVYIFVVSGSIEVANHTLDEKDQLRAEVDKPITLRATRDTDLVLIDLHT